MLLVFFFAQQYDLSECCDGLYQVQRNLCGSPSREVAMLGMAYVWGMLAQWLLCEALRVMAGCMKQLCAGPC
jgi:hypothetical protein